MELLETSSNQCKIFIHENERYVIRYPRSIGVSREYYRSTPEYEIIGLLIKNNIKVPKIIELKPNYLVQEYIYGELLSDLFEDHHKIDKMIIIKIVKQICLLTSINYKSLLNYINWTDNRSFYTFQCQNTEIIFQKYYQNLKGLYNALGISPRIISTLFSYASRIENKRSLSIIHGDRHKKNIILQSNGELIFIDWELGCVGDLAYDIAFHLHQMAYTDEDEDYFMNQLKKQYTGDFESLYRDIKLYRIFILARSCIYHVYWTNLLYQEQKEVAKKKQLGHFMRRYNKLSKISEFNLSYKNEEDLDQIFENFRKNDTLK
ncbi:MAG: phosphotransferase [Bacilli bacterium]|jgi:aminoglycoside phosphotransferase (APT) family kinase protein|nr:phosphotransferase [Bacilli bacterium]